MCPNNINQHQNISHLSRLTLSNGLEHDTAPCGEKVNIPPVATETPSTIGDTTFTDTPYTTENTKQSTQDATCFVLPSDQERSAQGTTPERSSISQQKPDDYVHLDGNQVNSSTDADIIDFNLCDSDDDEHIQQYLTYQRFSVFDMGPEFNQHYTYQTNRSTHHYWNDNEVSHQLRRIDRRLQLFVCDPLRTEYQLPEMPLYCRRQIQGLCTMYKIKIQSVAQREDDGTRAASMLRKGPKTHLPLDRQAIERFIRKSRTPDKARRHMERKPGGEGSSAHNRDKKQRSNAKSTVGALAPPLSDNNIGHRMLENMGWKQGDSLGVNKDGIADPIQPVIRFNRRGLGA